MDKKHYTCGYDFGTLSCRITVSDLRDGTVVFEDSIDYSHGVISGSLQGRPLPNGWALQDSRDYREAMILLTRKAIEKVPAGEIAAIGTDFTNCTLVALNSEGTPLCETPEFKAEPHAWIKLWKHHAAQRYADRIEQVLIEQNVSWFRTYGRKVSSEWLFPKLLQVYEEAPEVYEATDIFLEAADYIPFWLTGNLTRNSATLGINAFYNPQRGYPSNELLESFSNGFGSVLKKLSGIIKAVGSRAGHLTAQAAEALGLPQDVIVAVGHGDSEIVAIGMGLTEPGAMLMVMGTSTCYQMTYEHENPFEGICAVVKDGMLPELYSYESGQPAVGDSFSWFAENMLPGEYLNAAQHQRIPILSYMDKLCSQMKPGESGIISLDWFNGNRSVLMNFQLSGMIAGLTLETKPEAIYRSLIEATAFGARRILEGYAQAGVPIRHLIATGGLARKSAVTMQIYADVLGCPISVTSIPNASSLGAAICGASAFESENGSLERFQSICRRMVHYDVKTYKPNVPATEVYNKLYHVFLELHDFWGMQSSACTTLKQIQIAAKAIE